jgi:TusE/DsrC/DsvC family sulfur relay protein
METIVKELVDVELDEDGMLIDPAAWNKSVARAMARELGIGELNEDHWQIIAALRDHYAQNHVATAITTILRSHGKDWEWIHDLFQTSLNAWRVAGLPNPGEEAKSYLSDM